MCLKAISVYVMGKFFHPGGYHDSGRGGWRPRTCRLEALWPRGGGRKASRADGHRSARRSPGGRSEGPRREGRGKEEDFRQRTRSRGSRRGRPLKRSRWPERFCQPATSVGRLGWEPECSLGGRKQAERRVRVI